MLFLDESLSITLLPYCLINYFSLPFQVIHPVHQVPEFKVRPSFRALKSEASVILLFLSWVLPINVAVVEHMNSDKISHFSVHDFPFTKLECQVFILFLLLRGLGVVLDILQVELSRVVKYI